MTVWHKTPEYMLISVYYGNKCAKRSGVPLMNHIKEGIKLLIAWDRPEEEQRAFAIHPIVQNTGSLIVRRTMPSDSRPIHENVFNLAKEYSDKANSYLCNPDTDRLTMSQDAGDLMHLLGIMSTSCAWMLLADKVQNQKDFRTYHWFTHDRTHQLEAYFNLWIRTLKTYYI